VSTHVFISDDIYKKLEQDNELNARNTPEYIKKNISDMLDFIADLSQSKTDAEKIFNGGISLDDYLKTKGCLLSIKKTTNNTDNRLLGIFTAAQEICDGKKETLIIYSAKGSVSLEAQLQGYQVVKLKQFEIITGYRNSFSEEESLLLSTGKVIPKCYENEYLLHGSAVFQVKKESLKKVKFNDDVLSGIKPINIEQKMYVDLLMDNNIPVVMATGLAGSGKTLLPLAVFIEKYKTGVYKKLYLCRAAVAFEDIGFKPGTAKEKVRGFLKPILDNLNFLKAQPGVDKTLISNLIADFIAPQGEEPNGILEILPLEDLQGRTLSHAFILADEAQNLEKAHAVSLITRTGKTKEGDSKIVFCGDVDQIANPKVNEYTNGLTIVTRTLKHESLAGIITLPDGSPRSRVSNLQKLF